MKKDSLESTFTAPCRECVFDCGEVELANRASTVAKCGGCLACLHHLELPPFVLSFAHFLPESCLLVSRGTE